MIENEHLISFTEVEGAKNGIDATCSVIHKHEVFTIRSDKPADFICSRTEPRLLGAVCTKPDPGEFPQQKVRWLPLNLITQLLLRLQDAAWRRTNRTVIEISDIRIECPVLPHGMSEMFHTSKNRAPRLKKTGSEPHQIVSTRPESTIC